MKIDFGVLEVKLLALLSNPEAILKMPNTKVKQNLLKEQKLLRGTYVQR